MPDAKVAPPQPPNLATKLALITGEMRHIEKKGHNRAQNYDFVRESDVAEKASELLAQHHVWVHQTVVSAIRSELYQTQSGMTMWMTDVTVDFYFIDGDSGDRTDTQTFYGSGADTGDKGIYKAMTGAEKYFLMKSFLVSTGDDPEADEKVDKAVAATAAASGPRIVRGGQQGVERGGKTSGKATAAQVKEIVGQVRSLDLDQEAFVGVIRKAAGVEPAEGITGKDLLASLTSQQAADTIAALGLLEQAAAPAVDEGVETVDKEPPDPAQAGENEDNPGLAIV